MVSFVFVLKNDFTWHLYLVFQVTFSSKKKGGGVLGEMADSRVQARNIQNEP